jgi:hypothetical protein
MRKHIPHAIAVGLVGFLATYLSTHVSSGYTLWPVFVGWAAYYLGGAKPRNGFRVWTNMAFGGLCAVGIMYAAPLLTPHVGANYAFPLAICLGTFVIAMTEKVDFLNLVPFQFVGLGTFYALNYNAEPGNVAKMAGLLAVGMICGFANFHFRNRVSKIMGTSSPWPAIRRDISSVAAGEKERKAA